MRFLSFIVSLGLTAAVGCNNSEFSGGGGKAAPEEKKSAKTDDDARPKTKNKTPGKDTLDTGTGTSGETGSTAPANAVTAGHFKAWADPASPQEDQDYTIIIEVTLPPNVTPGNYAKEDLSGLLQGSDGYQQAIEKSFAPIPGPLPIIPPFDPRGKFTVNGKTARISFMVIGAASHVSDSITIHSRALNESQTVSLVFQ